ncbi:MAG: hypothetical protein JSV34_03715 [Candidatus Omnitrophota bacterium]|nr:MAG: hypothetical protein JSV34_03715 [Candidatus Omnitrophota bacterium]
MQNSKIEELLLRILKNNFIQIFIGLIFYFYYVGYGANIIIDKLIYGIYVTPGIEKIIASGSNGFIFLSFIIGIGWLLYKGFCFISNKGRVIDWLILGTFPILYIIYRNYLLIPLFLLIIIPLFLAKLKYPFIKYKLVIQWLVMLTSVLFVISYPVAIGETQLLFRDPDKSFLKESPVEILTVVSLDLPDEQRTVAGYLNTLFIGTQGRIKSVLVSLEPYQIIIIQNKEIIRIKKPYKKKDR